MYGTVKAIAEIQDARAVSIAKMEGRGGRLGTMQTLGNLLDEYRSMDGYAIETDQHVLYVLINNMQECCEHWGYFSSEDDFSRFIGAALLEVNLTDKALNVKKVEDSGFYEDEGGIQFVDFVTDRGTFQLAVYNAHNGYYGHGIVVAKDEEVMLSETL